jgi:hypothetical protein
MEKSLGIFHCSMAMGPGKVLGYLILGLSKLKANYKINEIGDSNIVLQNHTIIYENKNIPNLLLGPNVFDIPSDNLIGMNYQNYKSLIVSSNWVKNLYTRWIPEGKISVWNVGIDYDTYKPINLHKEYDFLIYHKRRSIEDLNVIIDFLEKRKFTYKVISYGGYSESDFVNIISKCRYGFVIDNSETQGIAIQEMMSCDLPLLVWDIKKWKDRGVENEIDATSVPYFDNTCGEIFYSLDELSGIFDTFINSQYQPRDYVLKHCNYVTQADKLLKLAYS